MATPDLERLAERVAQRRLRLNLSVRRAAELAGINRDTWARVEAGVPVRHLSYDKIEDALGWTGGSCRKIMDGGEAIDCDEAAIAPVPPEDLEEHIRQSVQHAMVTGTDLNASKIRDATDRAIRELRARGVLPSTDD